MFRRTALFTIALATWACADATRPMAPSIDVPVPSASVDEVIRAALPAHRGVALVEAYIDGRSELTIAGWAINTMHWTHFDGAAPGRLHGADFPTRVGPLSWYPQWPDIPDRENRDCHCRTENAHHWLDLWWPPYDLDPHVRRGRGTVTYRGAEGLAYITIGFDDNAFPGAEWYTVSLDTRFPLYVQPWPNQWPYVVSLSKQKYVSLALLSSSAAPGLSEPASLSGFSLGDDRGLETGIALGPGGAPLMRIADVNADGLDDAVVRFPVSGLVYHGDATAGSTVLKVTAHSPGWGYVRGELPVTFVP